MLLKPYTDLLRLSAVCPMKDACFLWIGLEHTPFFTVSLYDENGCMRLVNYHISGFKLNDLGEAKGVG